MQQLREQFGLDRPFHVQLWIYLKGVLTLDLGFSHRQQQPVWGLIAAAETVHGVLRGLFLVPAVGAMARSGSGR